MATTTVTKNAQSAVAFFQSKGFTKAQAAGIVGNLQAESGVDLKTYAVGDGGSAYGIAQWRPDRQADFQRVYGKPIQSASLNEQLEFINWELNNTEKSAGDRIRATKTASEAATITDQYYERSAGIARTKRVNYATALEKGSTGAVPPTGSTAPKPTKEPESETTIDPRTGKPIKVPPLGTEPDLSIVKEPDIIDFSQPLGNLLHEYPSYTYGLSLHLLTADEYNSIVRGVAYVPNRVLVASAGRYNNTAGLNQFIRSPYFAEDFYFNNFNMTTVIGTNQHSRNTNAIEFSFSLIEPYGMTLINRLLDQANEPEMQCSNYLDMVYLIQIDFFASNDAGEIVGAVPGITKRFPVKITQMNIKANAGGSEYEISAVPYNHTAFDQSTASIPANFEIVSGSLGEFYQSGASTNPKSQVTSLASALNGWQTDLVKNKKIGVPDSYSFNIDPSIAKSALTSSAVLSPRDTSMANPTNTNSIRTSNLGNSTKDFNPQTRTFSVNAGTSIDKVIDYTMRNSDYVQNQVNIPDGMDPQTYLQEKAKNANQPLNWYKTVPTVTLGAFDPIRKVYSRNITYNVQPYVIYNVKSDVAPQGKVTNFVKQYEYIYTGRNVDILDFDINFNTLYYTAQTAYRGAVADLYKVPANPTDTNNNKNSDSYQGTDQLTNNVMPMVTKPQVYNARSRATGGAISAKNVAVTDLEDSLMTLSAADMLSVQLKILGDPQFIKQDDVFYSPTVNASANDPRLTQNGSLRTDYGEIYVKLLFRTPIDIDEGTGLMNFGVNYRTSVFSGIYRVLTVQSEFVGGRFLQTLNLIRLPNQVDYDYVNKTKPNTSQRNTDIRKNNLPTLSNPQNIQNVGTPVQAQYIAEAASQRAGQNLKSQLFGQAPLLGPEQQKLINIARTATTTAITQSTEPSLIPPSITQRT